MPTSHGLDNMTNNITIEIPMKLRNPIFYTKKKHRVMRGGRNGGKSETVGRAILIQCLKMKGNVLCTRSVQNSIKDSVKKLLERLIKQMGFSQFYEVLNNEIRCSNGNIIMFYGMNALADPKSEGVKGLDEVKICWFEEAHTASERDIDILIPSIRANDAWFYWTYNSNKDPCYLSEYMKQHSKAEITNITYLENPFCTQSQIDEAEEMKIIDPQKYKVIWLGEPSTDTSRNVVILEWINCAMTLYKTHPENAEGRSVFGLDVKDDGGDMNALGHRTGLAFNYLEEWSDGDASDAADKAVEIMDKRGGGHLIFDRVGVGAAAKSQLKRSHSKIKTTAHSNGEKVKHKNKQYSNTGIKNKDMFANFGAQQWFKVRDLLRNSARKFHGLKDEKGKEVEDFITINPDMKMILKLKRELLQIEFEANSKEQVIIIKAPKGTKSPNCADAFQMTYRKPREISGVITV